MGLIHFKYFLFLAPHQVRGKLQFKMIHQLFLTQEKLPRNKYGAGARICAKKELLKFHFVPLRENNSPDKIGIKQIFSFNASLHEIS